jgi:hypothetical protein
LEPRCYKEYYVTAPTAQEQDRNRPVVTIDPLIRKQNMDRKANKTDASMAEKWAHVGITACCAIPTMGDRCLVKVEWLVKHVIPQPSCELKRQRNDPGVVAVKATCSG